MGSKGRYRYARQWAEFQSYLSLGRRPTTFEAAYDVVKDKVSGLYESEARAMWANIRAINPRSIVEVGRNLGGSLFLFACAAADLEVVLSLDIEDFNPGDGALRNWFREQYIDADLRVCDSTAFQPFGFWDLVFIDGGHTGDTVRADIACWRKRCQYIAFHDYADERTNKHKRCYPDVVHEISIAATENLWMPFGVRGRSDITYRTGVVRAP